MPTDRRTIRQRVEDAYCEGWCDHGKHTGNQDEPPTMLPAVREWLERLAAPPLPVDCTDLQPPMDRDQRGGFIGDMRGAARSLCNAWGTADARNRERFLDALIYVIEHDPNPTDHRAEVIHALTKR